MTVMTSYDFIFSRFQGLRKRCSNWCGVKGGTHYDILEGKSWGSGWLKKLCQVDTVVLGHFCAEVIA